MNTKVLAVGVVFVLIIGGLGVALAMGVFDKEKDKELNVIGRVNSEGSGLFLKSSATISDYLTVDDHAIGDNYIKVSDTEYINFYKANWGGKIFGTPGTSTIQHVQLQDIVINTLGLKFAKYTVGEATSSDTVYFTAVASYDAFFNEKSIDITGAYIWEAQYSLAVQNGCKGAITSDKLFPDHTCCIILGSHSYMKDNEEQTARFLAAYVESVNKMKLAMEAAPASEEYLTFIDIAVKSVNIPKDYASTDEEKKAVIEAALANVTYLAYDTETSTPLEKLKTDIASLSSSLIDLGAITKKPSDLGFKDTTEFSKKFVNDKYMAKAIAGDYNKDEGRSKVNITVAVISGDIHQLAIHYGMSTGIFEKYNVSITLSPQTNGPGVLVPLQSGDADFGFLGAPPATITTMNSSLVTA